MAGFLSNFCDLHLFRPPRYVSSIPKTRILVPTSVFWTSGPFVWGLLPLQNMEFEVHPFSENHLKETSMTWGLLQKRYFQSSDFVTNSAPFLTKKRSRLQWWGFAAFFIVLGFWQQLRSICFRPIVAWQQKWEELRNPQNHDGLTRYVFGEVNGMATGAAKKTPFSHPIILVEQCWGSWFHASL